MTNRLIPLLLLGLFAFVGTSGSHAAYPFPKVQDVAAGKPAAIDGIWRLTANNTRLQISRGRGYSLDEWQHALGFPIQKGDVLLKDIAYLGNGDFKGQDLPLSGAFGAKIQANGHLQFQVGWIPYTLVPIQLKKPMDYLGMMVEAGLDPDSSSYLKNWQAAEKRKRELGDELDQAPAEDGDPTDTPIDDSPVADDEPMQDDDTSEQEDDYPAEEEYPEEPIEDYPEDEEYPEFIDEEPLPEDEEALEEDEGEGIVADKPRLQKFKAKVHAKVKSKRRTCKGRNVYLSGGACYSCPSNHKRASLTRAMTHPQACQLRGLPKHHYVSATYDGKAGPIKGCPGKQSYRSDGGCYSCPTGYKRASLGRKMNHPKACQSRGLPKHSYIPAKFEYKLDLTPLPCPSGQFKHNGYCKSCPEGSKRVHFLGADTGYCISLQASQE